MHSKKLIVIFLLIAILNSCRTKNNTLKIKSEYSISKKDAELIRKGKVKSVTITELKFDSSEVLRWKKLYKTKEFDTSGNIIKEYIPNYVVNTIDPSLDFNDFLNNKFDLDTDIPDGTALIILRKYDSNNNCIELLRKKCTSNGNFCTVSDINYYSYDLYNNQIKNCTSSDVSETKCKYTIYEYDDKGLIISARDSISGSEFSKNVTKIMHFKYDKFYNIISGQRGAYSFDSLGNILSQYDFNSQDSIFYFYDNNKNLIKLLQKKTNTYPNSGAHMINYTLNEYGLPIEEKRSNSTNTFYIYKYDYSYYK